MVRLVVYGCRGKYEEGDVVMVNNDVDILLGNNDF